MEKLEQPDSLTIFEEGDVFALLTADTVENTEGVQVLHLSKNEIHIVYDYISVSNSIIIKFINYQWNGDSLGISRRLYEYYTSIMKPEGEIMKIITKPKNFLKEVETVDLDEQLSLLKCGDDDVFVKSLEGKRIWIIDRNTITDSTITLVETRILRLWKDVVYP